MPDLTVTRHAMTRCIERCHVRTEAEAIDLLTAPAVLKAADFGARYVRLGTGQRVVIVEHRIVTVLPSDHPRHRLGRDRDWRFSMDGGIV